MGMQRTKKYRTSQLPGVKEVVLKIDTNNWCSIRTTDKLTITQFKWMQDTKKYQISQLPAAQEVGLELDTNNRCSIITTHQTTHKLRITYFI